MIKEKIGYSYNDLTIIPSEITQISSRSECNPFLENGSLPIFASPMSTITNKKNIEIWKGNYITPIIPRNLDFSFRYDKCKEGEWVAFSLKEFTEQFATEEGWNEYFDINTIKDKTFKICIDLANGHMSSLYEIINKAKDVSRKKGFKLLIMTGNIANPETYEWICKNAEVDYIRVSIGTGNNCITSTQTGVHYPIASLIDECYKIKDSIALPDRYQKEYVNTKYCSKVSNDYGVFTEYKSRPMIIADGGIRGYSDVIKALGLGADYVMIGSLFTGLLESAAPLDIKCDNSHYKYSFNENGIVNNGIHDVVDIWDYNDAYNECRKRDLIYNVKEIIKESYGMSTKKAQKMINPNATPKTSEGCTKYIKVKETVYQWTENMISYMKSTMSYTNKRTLPELIGNIDFIINSSCAILAVNK